MIRTEVLNGRNLAGRPLGGQRGDVVDEISYRRIGSADQAQAAGTIKNENSGRVIDGVVIPQGDPRVLDIEAAGHLVDLC